MTYDLAVIGGGPGGYLAALRASQLGLKTACIEKRETLGGTCLNVGCIPSKTLLQTTQILAFLKSQGKTLGIDGQLKINFDEMMQRKSEVVKSLTGGIPVQFKKQGVDWLQGTAKLTSPNNISISNNKSIKATKILIASGSEPVQLPFLPFDEKKVLSSTGALNLKTQPKSMIVIGAGIIGVEIASVFSRLGTQVTLVEMLDHICGDLDSTIQKYFLPILTKQGLEFHLSTTVKSAEIAKKLVALAIEKNGERSTLEAEVVLVAVGRKPYTENLGLETIGVQKDKRGFIQVNDHFQTSVPSLYAIGDVIEGPMLAHKAYQEGAAVAEILSGKSSQVDYITIPNIIYTHPEMAACGLTEEQAKQLGLNVFTGISFMKANPRARTAADTEGLVKIIGDKDSGRLLGIHILAGVASEMIAEGVLALRNRMTVEEIATTCHAHPTYAEAIQEACLTALGRSIHAG